MLTLAKDKSTDYRIVVSESAPVSDLHAAGELAGFLREISGAVFPVVISLSAGGQGDPRRPFQPHGKISPAQGAAPGDRLSLRLSDGSLECRVEERIGVPDGRK